MLKKQKRVVAIHDISCVGKCSLTVALPILSAAGAETSIIPTAVLSTHTGGFTGYTYHDLTMKLFPSPTIGKPWIWKLTPFIRDFSGLMNRSTS